MRRRLHTFHNRCVRAMCRGDCLDATGAADQADGALSEAWDAGAGRVSHKEEVRMGWARAQDGREQAASTHAHCLDPGPVTTGGWAAQDLGARFRALRPDAHRARPAHMGVGGARPSPVACHMWSATAVARVWAGRGGRGGAVVEEWGEGGSKRGYGSHLPCGTCTVLACPTPTSSK